MPAVPSVTCLRPPTDSVSAGSIDACGAYVLMDYHTREIIMETTVKTKTLFPYIPGYLAYRELPVLQELFKQVKHPASVVLFDGNGVLHPRRCGLASHAGVLYNLVSIGVAKTPFKGNKNDGTANPYQEYALCLSKTAKKPVYVSPGHRISFETSKTVVQNVSTWKTPEPLRRAHQLAKTTLHKVG